MANQDRKIGPPARWGDSIVHPRRRASLAAAHRGERWSDGRYLAAYRRLLARHRRLINRLAIGAAAVVGLLVLGCAGLWWRLSSGPIQLDAFSPWLGRDRREFRQPRAGRSRRNADRAYCQWRRRRARP